MEVQFFTYERHEIDGANAEIVEFLDLLKKWDAKVRFVQQSQTHNLLIISIWFDMPRGD